MLIVAAVVLLLLTLTLTGVQKVRESASRMKCHNNLRQIGLALHNYTDVYNRFPAATYPNPEFPPERRLSWLFELDPFVHARMDPDWRPQRNEPWDSEANLKLVRGRMPWYVCPDSTTSNDASELALTHYVGITGVGADAVALPQWHPRGGAFNYERGITFIEFRDSVETVMLIETALDNGPWIAGGRPTARPFDPEGLPPVGRGGQFGGLHRGGANMMCADAHIFFVRDTVSPAVLASQITIAAGDSPLPFPD